MRRGLAVLVVVFVERAEIVFLAVLGIGFWRANGSVLTCFSHGPVVDDVPSRMPMCCGLSAGQDVVNAVSIAKTIRSILV